MAEKIWTKEEIRTNLEKSDKWVMRAIIALFKYQTEDEKCIETTRELNNVGFSGCDAHIMTSFAKWIDRGLNLTPKQMVIARKKTLKYAGQLAKIANKKQ